MKSLSTKKSDKLFSEAKKYLPGGVNSPVRAFKSVGRGPLFISKAKGQYIFDVDGNKFIDYVRVLGADDLRPRTSTGCGCDKEDCDRWGKLRCAHAT